MSRSSLVIRSILLAAYRHHERCPASPYSPTVAQGFKPAQVARLERNPLATRLAEVAVAAVEGVELGHAECIGAVRAGVNVRYGDE